MTAAAPLDLDLDDFDALGVATQVIVALRSHAIGHDMDTVASVEAPLGWHRLTVTARRSGHVVLAIRYRDLTASRLHNISKALDRRGWLLDEDSEGSTCRYPPGTEPSDASFEMLEALTVAGAPAGRRIVTATDAAGRPVSLTPTS